MDLLQGLWSPIANAAGAIAGVVTLHLWGRFRRRMVTLRWTCQTQAFAPSGADATHVLCRSSTMAHRMRTST